MICLLRAHFSALDSVRGERSTSAHCRDAFALHDDQMQFGLKLSRETDTEATLLAGGLDTGCMFGSHMMCVQCAMCPFKKNRS